MNGRLTGVHSWAVHGAAVVPTRELRWYLPQEVFEARWGVFAFEALCVKTPIALLDETGRAHSKASEFGLAEF
jgi:hypothetical protein